MGDEQATAIGAQWQLTLPAELQKAWEKLGPDDAVGMWTLSPRVLDPAQLEAGGPVGLFVIGDNGMGDSLCLYQDPLVDGEALPVVMWSPEGRQITRLGSSVADFFERESHRRVEFLLEQGPPLDEGAVAKARAGEAVSFEGLAEEARPLAELLADTCRVAGVLGLSDAVFDRAAGKGEPATFLREVDGKDEKGIEDAIGELKQMAESGDAAAAFEVLGFLQMRQKNDEVARWAYSACKCSLFTWPSATPTLLQKLIEVLKKESAAIAPKERIDPLFAFVTTQPTAKVEGRLALAKQYMRKKEYKSALREAENALLVGQWLADPAAVRAAMASAYELARDVLQAAERPVGARYAELMLAKVRAS